MTELSILAAAEEFPEMPCLIAHGEVYSYAQIAARSAALIDRLASAGLEPGDRVALIPRADVDSIVSLFALFEIGCSALLVHPRLTGREREQVLASAGEPPTIDPYAPTPTIATLPVHAPVPEDRTLAIVYTSGSRGAPRGAKLSRRAFLASARAHRDHLGWLPDDRWLLAMPPAHVGGLSILSRSLIARSCVVVASGPFEPAAILDLLEQQRVTLMSLVPTMLQRLLDADPTWSPPPFLRAVLVGGAPFPEALRQRAVARQIPALATYGCTEACSQVATQSPSEIGQPGSGRPLQGIEVRIEGAEIQVRGEILMDGYLGEAQDGETWADGGWLRTGDQGRFLPDGQLQVLGRLDDRIVTGGENVSPLEVEAWLETLVGISSACVFGVPDPSWGEVVAAAIAIEPALFDFEILRDAIRSGLAGHKRPRRIAVLDELPLNRSGKVDRARVLSLASTRFRSV
jgi:O-succinylbenzoic acid--CoA ligase